MTVPERKPPTSAFILAFTAIYLIWGSTYLGIRITVETMPPFLMAAARFFIAGSIMLLVLRWRGQTMPTGRQWRDSLVAGTLLLLGGNGAVVWAEQYIPSGVAALIIGIQPVFMVLTEWAWPGGQRPTLAVFVGMVIGFLGVAWLAAPWEATTADSLNLPGMVAVLVGCASWALGSIYSRHAKPAAAPLVGAGAQMLCGSITLAIAAAVRGEFGVVRLEAISSRSWWAFAYLVTIGSWVGFSTFVWLMKHSTPARVSTYAYVNPVVAVFLGWLILHEPVSPRTTLSAILIVAAVVIVTTQKNRKRAIPTDESAAPASPAPVRR